MSRRRRFAPAGALTAAILAACGSAPAADIHVHSSLGPWDDVEDGAYAIGSSIRLRFEAEEGWRFSDAFRLEAEVVSSDPAVARTARLPEAEEEDWRCWEGCFIAEITFLSAGEAEVRLEAPGSPPLRSVTLNVSEVDALFLEDALPDDGADLGRHPLRAVDPAEPVHLLEGGFPFVFVGLMGAGGRPLKGHLPLTFDADDPDTLLPVRLVDDNPGDEANRFFQLEARRAGETRLAFVEPARGARHDVDFRIVPPEDVTALEPFGHEAAGGWLLGARGVTGEGDGVLGGRCTFSDPDGDASPAVPFASWGCNARLTTDEPVAVTIEEALTGLSVVYGP